MLADCIHPVNCQATNSRRKVTMESTSDSHTCVTAPPDGRLTLEEPDFVSKSGWSFVYLWTKVIKICAVASHGGSGVGGESRKSCPIGTSFDQRSRLPDVHRLKKSGNSIPGAPDPGGSS